MTFNSVTFAVFLVAVLAVYWSIAPRWRNLVLLVASYVFYGWWDWRFLSLIAISTVVDFLLGRRIHAASRDAVRKRLLWVSVSVNLGILGLFKYHDFFVESAADLLSKIGIEPNPWTLGIALPVGISFYTFQTISYSFDIYRRRIEPTSNPITFATYVAYFPQLVAGPIERAQRLLPQIENIDRRPPDADTRREAYRLILMGLVKKVVLADGVASIVNEAFADPGDLSWLALVAGTVGFAVQIYGDFSGYTDIARGVSKLLGIELVVNFTQPYLSRNITEFWRRWHISLSDWLRDYLYIPLGGNRGGTIATNRNLMLTMLLGGLWHGASWNFVIWGGLHGLYLGVHRMFLGGRVPEGEPTWRELPSILLTNVAVLLAWIFFRAESLEEAWTVLNGIITLQSGAVHIVDVLTVAAFAAAALVVDLLERRRTLTEDYSDALPPQRSSLQLLSQGAAGAAVVVTLIAFSGGTPVPFIYFQF